MVKELPLITGIFESSKAWRFKIDIVRLNYRFIDAVFA